MRKFMFLFIFTIIPKVCEAQYYNPYGTFQQQQQANRNAYEMGRRMMEQQMAQYEKQLKQNPMMMMGVATEDMAYGRYEKAYERFEYLAENYNNGSAWLYIGYMNELGMGTSQSYNYAKMCYTQGAELGEPNCKAELQRIKKGKYLGSEYKTKLRNHFQSIVAMGMQSANSMNWGYGNNNNNSSYGNNNSSNSDKLVCPTCHGTKKCTMCAGRGEKRSNNGYLYDCGMCHGGGACYGCHGRGWIR